MAFPTSTSPTTTTFATSVTSMAVNLPASIAAGDLLIAHMGARNLGNWTAPSGWVLLEEKAGGGGVGESGLWYKIATGSESSTATWTTSVGSTASWHVRKITGWHGTTPPEYASTNGDFTTAPNPPSLTPSWGADNTLWLALAGSSATVMNFTAAPAAYGDLTSTVASTGGGASNAGSAIRRYNTATEDPGLFTTSQNRWWATFTVAVRPLETDTLIITVDGDGATTSGWGAEGGDYTRVQSDDGDTTRLYTPTSGQIRQFSLTTASSIAGEDIKAVTVYAKVRGLADYVTNNSVGLRISSTDYWSPNLYSSGTSYSIIAFSWFVNPATGVAWTTADIESLQAGIRKNDGLGTGLTYFYVGVDYVDGGGSTIELVADDISSTSTLDSATLTIPPPDDSDNLVPNPSFEETSSGWAVGWVRDNATVSTVDTTGEGQAPNPTNSLKTVSTTSTEYNTRSALFPVVFGETYYFSFTLKILSRSSGSVDWFFDEYSSSSSGDWVSWQYKSFKDSTGVWRITGTYTPTSSGVNHASIGFLVAGTSTSYIDEVEVKIKNEVNEGAKLSITFDDGFDSVYQNRYILSSRGIPATTYITSDYIGTGAYTRWASVQDLHDNFGWEIGNHTKTHSDQAPLNEAQLVTEIGGSQSAILSNTGVTPKNLAWPFGSWDALALQVGTRYLRSFRTYTAYGDGGDMAIQYEDTFMLGTSVENTHSVATVKGWIDNAVSSGEYLNLVFHDLVASSPGQYAWTTADFEELMDYIVTLRDADDIKVETVEQARNLQQLPAVTPVIIGPVPLTASDLSSTSTLDTAVLTQKYQLTLADLVSSSTVDPTTLTQKYTLTASELLSSASLDAVSVTHDYILSASDLSSSSTLENVALTQGYVLTAADLSSAVALDALTIVQAHILAASDLISSSALDSVSVTQSSVLTVQDLLSSAALDGVTLTQSISLAISSLDSAPSLENAAVLQSHELAASDLSSSSSIDNTSLTQKNTITIDSLSSNVTLEEAALSSGAVLLINDLTSVSTLEALSLTQSQTLTVTDVLSGASLESGALSQKYTLTSADLVSSSSLEGISLFQGFSLVIQDVNSLAALDSIAITQKHTLQADGLASLSFLESVVVQLTSDKEINVIDLTVQDAPIELAVTDSIIDLSVEESIINLEVYQSDIELSIQDRILEINVEVN